MKKLLISVTLLLALAGCETRPFKGFLVCKEYIPGHMDNEDAKSVQEAYVYIPVFRAHRHVPKYIPSEWHFYVANRDGVRDFQVDSLTYTRHKVGERIVMGLK